MATSLRGAAGDEAIQAQDFLDYVALLHEARPAKADLGCFGLTPRNDGLNGGNGRGGLMRNL